MRHFAEICWVKRSNDLFVDGKYSRAHQWRFDGGMQVEASSSPAVIPLPMSDPSLVDPEEAFIASIASCHMLFFLSFCAKQRYIVVRYEDHAEGIMGVGDNGKKLVASVILQPVVQFEGDRFPTADTLHQLHELAHENCFIANSVKTKIVINSNHKN